jgi:hypothetical protein
VEDKLVYKTDACPQLSPTPKSKKNKALSKVVCKNFGVQDNVKFLVVFVLAFVGSFVFITATFLIWFWVKKTPFLGCVL